MIRVALLIAGSALALLGQNLVDNDGYRLFESPISALITFSAPSRILELAFGLYVLALVAWLFGNKGWLKDLYPVPSEPATTPPRNAVSGRHTYRSFSGSLGVISVFLASGLYYLNGESWVIWGLWFGGIALFFFSQNGTRQNVATPAADLTFERLVVLALFSAALLARLIRLDQIPFDVHGDMASYGLEARNLLGTELRLIGYGWAGIPMLGYLPTVLGFLVAGDNLIGLRLMPALEGSLSILGFYLLVRELFGRRPLALLSAFIVVFNPAHIHFSRIPAYIDPWPYHLFGLLLLIRGLKLNSSRSLAGAGILIALGSLAYFSGRSIPLMLILFFPLLAFFQPSWLRGRGKGLAIFALAFLLTVGPNFVAFSAQLEAFNERTRSVMITDHDVLEHSMNKYDLHSFEEVLLEQVKRSLLAFNCYTDTSGQFNFYPFPLLPSIFASFFVLSLGTALYLFRHPGILLTAPWLALIMLVGAALTVDPPFTPRLVGSIFPAAVLSALGIITLIDCARFLPWRLPRAAFVVLICAGLSYGTLQSLGAYLHHALMPGYGAFASVGRYIMTLPQTTALYAFDEGWLLTSREIEFLAPNYKKVSLPKEANLDCAALAVNAPVVWVLTMDQIPELPRIGRCWPQGRAYARLGENSSANFVAFESGL